MDHRRQQQQPLCEVPEICVRAGGATDGASCLRVFSLEEALFGIGV